MIHELPNWRTHDDQGVMMPWYTRPCLEWLDKLYLKDKFVFEYGCGASSLWWFSRGALTLGVDTKAEWLFLDDEQHHETEKDKYLQCIEDQILGDLAFDIVVIDGDWRDECTGWALENLKKGGHLICDNFEQPSADLAHWPKTRELTKNLKVVGMFKEPLHEDWVSAVWQNLPA